MKIGLIINPIAGIGAKLAWKGTDNVAKAWEVVNEGYLQPVWEIVDRALNSIQHTIKIKLYIIADPNFKLDVVQRFKYQIVDHMPKRSSAIDTIKFVKKLSSYELDLLIFVGGDGTASDIASVDLKIPIIGVPGGVKIFSPCFVHKPEDIGGLIKTWNGGTKLVDLLDLDEEAYRKGMAVPSLVGEMIIPKFDSVQLGKSSWSSTDDQLIFESIGSRVMEDHLFENKILLIGAGGTLKRILEFCGLNISLLGIDVINNGDLIIKDATYSEIKNVHEKFTIDEIWISPIGVQGHIFGRGNKQIPVNVIADVGKSNVRIFATQSKLINTPELYTDCGDTQVDEVLQGYYEVITGFHTSVLRKVK